MKRMVVAVRARWNWRLGEAAGRVVIVEEKQGPRRYSTAWAAVAAGKEYCVLCTLGSDDQDKKNDEEIAPDQVDKYWNRHGPESGGEGSPQFESYLFCADHHDHGFCPCKLR